MLKGMILAATKTAAAPSFSALLHGHEHLLLIVIAVVVLAVVAIKIIQHLVVIAALVVAAGIAVVVLFPGFRHDLPGFQQKATTTVHKTAVTLEKNKTCDSLKGKLRTDCVKRVQEIAKKTAPGASTKASASHKK